MEFKSGTRWHSKQAFLEVSEMSVVSLLDDYKANETIVNKFAFHSSISDDVGPYMEIHFGDGVDETLRFYWMPPEMDWRKNQTYFYKLTSSWISSDSQDWLFWNVNNQVDSDLILPTDRYHGLQCEYMEFHYKERSNKKKKKNNPFAHDATLKMWDVQTGFVPKGQNLTAIQLYKPCELRTCRAIDGKVYCGAWRPWVIYTLVVSLAVVSTCLGCVMAYCCTRGTTAQYQPVKIGEHDDDDNDDEGDVELNGVETYRDDFEDEPENGIDMHDDDNDDK